MDRERIEREAEEIMAELVDDAMPTPRWLSDRIVSLVLRERAAVWEKCAKKLERAAASHEAARDEAAALGLPHSAQSDQEKARAVWDCALEFRALAAQERDQ